MSDWFGGLAASCTPSQEPEEETREEKQARRARRRAARESEESAKSRNRWGDDASEVSDNTERSARSGRTAVASGRTTANEAFQKPPKHNSDARKVSYEMDGLDAFDSGEEATFAPRKNVPGKKGTPPSNHSMVARELRLENERRAAAKKAALFNPEEAHRLDDPTIVARVKGAADGKGWKGDDGSSSSRSAGGLDANDPESKCFGMDVVILPQAWYVMYWDGFMMLLLFTIIFLLPYEAAFVVSYTNLAWDAMNATQRAFMVMNRLMDGFFVIDLFVQFVLGYVDNETQKVVTSLPKIRERYLRSYFVIDVVSLFPFDQVVESSSTPFLRAIKFLRMLKLLRAMKANRIMGRLLSHVDVSNWFIKVCKDLLALAIVMHCLVCAWAYQASESGVDDVDRWIYLNDVDMSKPSYVYTSVIQLLFTSDIQVALIDDQQLKIATSAIIYILMAFTIAELTDMVAQMNEGDAAFNRMLDELNYLMRERNFPMDLRFRLRDFLRFKHDGEGDLVTSPERQELMKALSPTLQTEVADQLSKVGLKQAPLLKNCKSEILMRITMAATSSLLGATEVVSREGEIADHLCILDRGFLIAAGRVVRAGNVFGHECLLSGGFEETTNAHSTHTLTFSTITKIHVHQLDQIVRKADPAFWWLMRKRALASLAARGLVMYTQLAKRFRTDGTRGARALASEMVSLGVGRIVVYKMLLAFRYVNGESATVEHAARKIQSWYRGVRVRSAFKKMVFRARVTSAYLPTDLIKASIAANQSDFGKLIARFGGGGDKDDVPMKLDALSSLCESNAQQIGMLLVEHRRMSRTVDSVALLVRKIALGL
jgi:hypothetical protein